MNYIKPKNYKEVNGYVLCKQYTHSFMGTMEAIPNRGIKDGYEKLHVDKETDKYFYGMPVEGMGLVDCMILKSDCRPFTDEELEAWKKVKMGMYGSHSGKLDYTYDISVNDLMRSE